jgi:hypothetical protein
MTTEIKRNIVRAFCSPRTAELVNNLFYSERINAPFDALDFNCRLHKSRVSGTINLEMLRQSPIGLFWQVIGIYEKSSSSHQFKGTLMFNYADVLKERSFTSLSIDVNYCDVLKRNAVFALYLPDAYSHIMKTKSDAKFLLNGIYLDVLSSIDNNTFNVWLDDRYGLSMPVGVMRMDMRQIDSVTGVTDMEYDWCHRHELLTLYKSVGVNSYESESQLENNRF